MSATRTAAGLSRGAVVEGYRVEGVIGRQTGAGVVYVAADPSTGKKVALKLLPRWLTADEAALARLFHDVSIQSALCHKHIIKTHGSGRSSSGPFLIMDLARGTSLKRMIAFRELDERRALDLLLPVAEALDFAHRRDMPHRDLKPQKIIVSRDGNAGAMVADFGAAKPRHMSDHELSENLETLEYAAPEQLRGKIVTGASNVYSLAVILFECLIGASPFEDSASGRGDAAHPAPSPPSLGALRPDLDRSLDAVIRKGMAIEPAGRFSSSAELVRSAVSALGENRSQTAFARTRSAPPTAAATVPFARAVPASALPVSSAPPGAPASAVAAPVTKVPLNGAPDRTSESRTRQTAQGIGGEPRRLRVAPLGIALVAAGLITAAAAGGWLAGRPATLVNLISPTPTAAPLSSSPSEVDEYAEALHDRIAALNSRRTSLRQRLGRARTPVGQAETARALGRTYGATARSLTAVDRPPSMRAEHAAIVARARQAREAYGRLALRARRGDDAGYRRSVSAVGAAELAFARALRRTSARGGDASNGP